MDSTDRDGGVQRPDPALRDELVDRFTAWLDEVLSDERPPEGLPAELLAAITSSSHGTDAEKEPDLHRLWAAMTSLAQEVKLQGRAFDRLGGSLKASQQEIVRQAQRQVQLEMLEAQMDVRDRLLRGLATSQAHLIRARRTAASSWLLRLCGSAFDDLVATTEAVREGNSLAVARVDQLLTDSGVSEIECVDRPFDPTCMRAVAVEAREGRGAGEVLEVLRRGYRREGEVLRYAEVRLTGRPGPDDGGGPPEGLLPEPGADP